ARVELCLVEPDTARREFVLDRENQMLDSFYTLIEPRRWMRVGREFPDYESLRRRVKMIDELCLYLADMAHFAPDNEIAGHYRRQVYKSEDTRPYTPPQPPSPEVPLWAFQQNLIVKKLQGIGNWWIENRQASTGELGSGLGDDSDLIQNWPGLALMDGPAEAIRSSVRLVMEICYEWGRVVDGLNRRRTDALHAYEEGINTPPLALLLDYGDPLVVERLMETARHYERLTGINPAGHRHFRSWMVSATDIVEEGIHARQDIWSPLMFHPGLYLAWYNGHQPTIKIMSEFADGLLDHWKSETYPDLALGIMFASDEVIRRDTPRTDVPHILWGLYDMTGDKKYLWLLRESLKHQDWNAAVGLNANWLNDLEGEVEVDSLLDYSGRMEGRSRWLAGQTAWELTGELKYLEDYQAELLKELTQNIFLYTEAHHYTDRVWVPSDATQRARLGGVVHRRNCLYPGHAVSWENSGGDLAALVLESGRDNLKCLLYNLSPNERTVTARIWRLEPGSYRVKLGPDKDRDRVMDRAVQSDRLDLRRAMAVELVLPGRQQAVLEIDLIKKTTPLQNLPDPAIGEADLNYDRESGKLTVTVHNLGMRSTGAFTVRLSDSDRVTVAEQKIKNIEAPIDLIPRTQEIVFENVKAGTDYMINLDPENKIDEITDMNNEGVIRL
ncbi:CARDB domain-containing protein, partial [candidate division KSB1 bacterium]